MTNLDAKETEPSGVKKNIGPDSERRINSISWLGIIILIIIIAIFIILFVYYIVLSGQETVNTTVKNGYILMWGDDFNDPDFINCGSTINNEKIPYNITSKSTRHINNKFLSNKPYDFSVGSGNQKNKYNVYQKSSSDIVKKYPDLERWTLQQSIEPGPTYFTSNVENGFIRKGFLHQRLLPLKTIIIQDKYIAPYQIIGSNEIELEGSSGHNQLRNSLAFSESLDKSMKGYDNSYHEYDYTSSRIISRIATIGGFFNIRCKLPCEPGIKVKLSLLPYINVCMNQIGSDYGDWPFCGEITLMEYNTDDQIWRGYLTYGGNPPNTVYYPYDDKIMHLDPNQWQIIGLEWTGEYMKWIYNGSVKDGCINGETVQSVKSDKWFTLQETQYRGCSNKYKCAKTLDTKIISGVELDKYKKLPAPAPFNRPFHLVMEITVNNEVHKLEKYNSERIGGTLLVDWVKLYNCPQSEIRLNDLLSLNESTFDNTENTATDISNDTQ